MEPGSESATYLLVCWIISACVDRRCLRRDGRRLSPGVPHLQGVVRLPGGPGESGAGQAGAPPGPAPHPGQPDPARIAGAAAGQGGGGPQEAGAGH